MGISYIKNGASSLEAAEKIKLAWEEKRTEVNPWIDARLSPSASEAVKSGGGIYRFENILGYDKAERRASAPSNNQIDFTDGMTVAEVVLTVGQPFITPVYTFEESDVVQLDGIDFSAKSTKKVLNVLVKAEVDTDTATVLNNTAVRTATIAGTTPLDQAKELKQSVSDYYDISADGAWTADATKYFDAQRGDFLKEELTLHLHPKRISFLSDLNTDAGAGSAAQFLQFQEGTLTHVDGVKVKANKHVGINKAAIMPVGMIGVPDDEVMATKVKAFNNESTDTNHTRGWHWFDSVLVAPELVTIITLPAIPAGS